MTTVNGLHLLLAFAAALAAIGWAVDYRRRVRVERQRDALNRIVFEKNRRLMVALDERDQARAHADDAQWVVDAMATAQADAQQRHPSYGNVRVLRPAGDQA